MNTGIIMINASLRIEEYDFLRLFRYVKKDE